MIHSCFLLLLFSDSCKLLTSTVCLNPNICLHVNGTFAHMPVTHAVCTDAPISHILRQTFAFAFVADKSLDGCFGLWDWQFDVCFPQKQAEMWTHLTTAHIFTVFLTIWDELRPRELAGVSLPKIDQVKSSQVELYCHSATCGDIQWNEMSCLTGPRCYINTDIQQWSKTL